MQQFQNMLPFGNLLSQRNFGNDSFSAPGMQGNWMDRRQQHLSNGFNDIGMMMNSFFQMNSMNRDVQANRFGFYA
ncbi:hypothetical protein [Hyalangium versicolor]|uniref:hypothetical protein n=1 Tax=Hyalangium versicolor TaxID=2861190 RepID=UPI001CCA8517|nr:hypothetical protein [Hyalangium versicolor]